jgi:hypothetical protein
LTGFADAWTEYRQTLIYALSRFRPFQYWEGDAAASAEASMDEQRKWLIDMVELCDTLVRQAAQTQVIAATPDWFGGVVWCLREIWVANGLRWMRRGWCFLRV